MGIRIGTKIFGVWVFGTVNAAVFTIGFFIKMAIFLVFFGLFFAFVAPPAIEWVMDQVVPLETRQQRRVWEIEQLVQRDMGKTYHDRHLVTSNALHFTNELKRKDRSIDVDELMYNPNTGEIVESDGVTMQELHLMVEAKSQAEIKRLTQKYSTEIKEITK
jgi:hypothetical protein